MKTPIKDFLSTLTHSPGVYQMFNAKNQVLYIGKALNLKKRVSSYFQKHHTDSRLASLVKQIESIKVIVTQNESEALLLENQLIKEYLPKYNILLRDDKSYPYIILSDHAFPRLSFQRGKTKNAKNKQWVFGPYPNTTAVRETMKIIQKLFKLRVCRDNFFNQRTRPCLLYQIHLCTGPCTQLIGVNQYQEDVTLAKLLLQGKNKEILKDLIRKMEKASKEQSYEIAAKYRDQIHYLKTIQAKQVVVTQIENAFDIFALVEGHGEFAIEHLMVREGRLINSQTFYPKVILNHSRAEIISAFIAQYYLNLKVPKEVLISENCHDKHSLESLFGFELIIPKRGEKLRLIQMAIQTGLQALKSKTMIAHQSANHFKLKFDALSKVCHLQNTLDKIVCFDISHHHGESAVASAVVCGEEGFEKKYYRQYNIQDITPGDDYAAMSQAIKRFLENENNAVPDILLIDGGVGQVHAAQKILASIPYDYSQLVILGISKGPDRKPGCEKLLLSKQSQIVPLELSPESEVFHLLQQIRDEAHRFAITQHRKKQSRKRNRSLLENIEGVGLAKRKALLQHLGGLQEIKNASVERLSEVPGINRKLAEKIHQFFHS